VTSGPSKDPEHPLSSSSYTRRSILKGGLGSVALFAAAPVIAACGGSSGGGGGGGGGGALKKLRDAGVARMAVTETLPSSGLQNGKGVAVFPEVGSMVLKEIGIPKVEYVNMQFGAQIPSLKADRVDLAAGGLYMTDERCAAILFSDPELAYLEGLAVPKGNPKKILGYGDIAKNGFKLGVVTGSFEIDLAKEAKVSDSKVQRFPDIPAMYDGLKAGRVDVVAYDNVTISYFAAQPQYSGAIEAAPPFDPVDDGLPSSGVAGMGFQKGATDLRDAYNKKQAEMFAAGAFDDIYKQWNVPPENVKLTKESPKAAELCKAA
jgi:polar amino acid transport system substrate-binding protein